MCVSNQYDILLHMIISFSKQNFSFSFFSHNRVYSCCLSLSKHNSFILFSISKPIFILLLRLHSLKPITEKCLHSLKPRTEKAVSLIMIFCKWQSFWYFVFLQTWCFCLWICISFLELLSQFPYVFLSECRFEIYWAFVITLRWCADLTIIRCVLFSTYALIVFYFIVLWLLFMQRFFTFIYDILYSWFLIFMAFTRSSEQVQKQVDFSINELDFSIRTLLPRYVMKLLSFRLLYL